MKIFLLNGPAGSGKDFAANALTERFSGTKMKFATPLKLSAAAIYFGGNYSKFAQFDEASLEIKNAPREEFFGISCRQAQINISENFLKPQHGERVFGKILASNIKQLQSKIVPPDVVFISDSGFEPEGQELIDEFGARDVILIRIHREGHTFEGDSRSYISLGVREFDVTNNGDETFEQELIKIVEGAL